MPVLLAQCALPPVLLALVSWLQRRRGPALGGLLAGLPLTSGPIVLSVAIEHGPGFAARTATATLGGAASASALCWAYARTARRGGPGRALAAGCAVFAAGSAVQQTAHPAPAAIALTGFLTVAVVLLRWPGYQAADAAAAPGSPLAVRAALVTCYVLAAAALSPAVGPQATGLFSPFPVLVVTQAVHTHRTCGPATATAFLHGVARSTCAFLAFFATLAATLRVAGVGWAFPAALAAGAGTQWVVAAGRTRGSGGRGRSTAVSGRR